MRPSVLVRPVKDATAVQQPGNLTATPQDTALAARSGRQVSVSLATYSKIGRLLFSHWPPGGAGMQTPPPAEHTSSDANPLAQTLELITRDRPAGE